MFLSYASQDAEVAKRVCEALRGAGLEVWFDQSELRGGDAWDQKIRRQIKECALFVPLITANTNARPEGYFRLEWKLAVDRSHLMADDAPFLFPIVVGDVTDATARVPEKFRDVQWTRLRLDETPAELAARVAKLLTGDVGRDLRIPPGSAAAAGSGDPALQRSGWQWWMIFPIIGTIMGLVFAFGTFFRPRSAAPATPAPAVAPAATAPAPAAKSVSEARQLADREWPLNPKLKKAFDIITAIDTSFETSRLAEDIVNAELKERPTDAEATTLAAMVSNYMINRGYDISEDRFVTARRFSDRALQLAPEDPEALAAAAQYLTFRRSDVVRAEQLIRKAIALAPAEPRFSRILVYNVLYGTRNLDAVAEGKAARLRFPNDPLTHYNLALICRSTGDLELMEQCLDQTIALAPVGSAMIWKGWLTAWFHGDLPGFKLWLEKISGNFRSNERAIYMRYVYACLSGDAHYGLQAVQSYPGSWMNDFYFNGPRALLAADLLARQGRKDLAREEYERALAEIQRVAAANPADRSADRAKLWVLLGLGRMEEARVEARKLYEQQARPFWPAYTVWWHHVIPAELLTGNRAEALALMKEAAALAVIREQMRVAMKIDPRMAPFRDDPEIQAILTAPPDATAAPNAPRATSGKP